MTQGISIYTGPGTAPSTLSGRLLTPDSILHSSWASSTRLLIMPGGRDRPYHAALQGAGNAKIRSFVEGGGTYLGICAGAYYGASHVEFDKGHSLEVCEARELAFFSGTALGPIYGLGSFDYASNQGARAALIATPTQTLHAYFNGGCTFVGDLSNVQILARYADLPGQPPAIIACPVGKGLAILSGVHLEISVDALDPNDPYLAKIMGKMKKSEEKRKAFWEEILAGRAMPSLTHPPKS